MKILLAIDNSHHSNIAINDVAGGLWSAGSEVLVTTAVWSPFGANPHKSAPDAATRLVATAAEKISSNKNVKSIETRVVMGNPKTDILTILNSGEFDLLVIGSRPPSMQKVLFGSVSHALLLGSPCSVRISRREITRLKRRVLLAFDGSEFCWRALEVVGERSIPEGTEIFLLNAIPTLEESSYDNPDIFSMDQLEQGRNRLLEIAQEGLARATEQLSSKLPQCKISSKLLNGHPRKTLISACEDYNADLIFVGTQGKNFSAQLAIGSVSEAVAVGAPCTVEIVKLANKR